MKEIIDIVHKSIYPFFDVCEDGKEEPLSDKDKLLLSVNKAICTNLKALEQETYGDCISRQEVHRQINEWVVMSCKTLLSLHKRIDTLPIITSKPKEGHWIHHEAEEFVCAEHWECSQCHRTTMTYPFSVSGNDYNAMYYCPKCGAKMVEDTGSEG